MQVLCVYFCTQLSKSKGQVLKVAAALHVLSHIKAPCTRQWGGYEKCELELEISNRSESYASELEISNEISEAAIKAAINFVGLCCQQTAYMTGRGSIKEEVQIMKTSKTL